jgi:hypothetical protein
VIPRWASDPELLNKIVQNQTQEKAKEIFGRVRPEVLKQVNVMKMLGEYKDLMSSDKWYAYEAE